MKPINTLLISTLALCSFSSATYADALATAFNVIGYPKSIDYANANNIALMLVTEIDGKYELIFSNEWYNLGL